jgi:hypothetical protein
MIKWMFYPHSDPITAVGKRLTEVFETEAANIASDSHELTSNEVLAFVSDRLALEGFEVESGKKEAEKVPVPVLFGPNGKIEKHFDADAYHQSEGFVLEIEEGRAVANNQFLKDLFQACMMREVKYLAIAVRLEYRKNKDFVHVCKFFETLYASGRLKLPLLGVLVIGY